MSMGVTLSSLGTILNFANMSMGVTAFKFRDNIEFCNVIIL